MNPHPDLKIFLKPYSNHIQEITKKLRKFILDVTPEANELIWDNYNAVAIAYSKSDKLKDAYCHLAVYTHHVNFGFNRGAELSKSKIQLEGKSKLIRHVKVKDLENFDKTEMKKMVLEAQLIAETHNPTLVSKLEKGKSMVMSISKKKIRPINKD